MSKYKNKREKYPLEEVKTTNVGSFRIFLNSEGKAVVKEEDWEFEDRKQKAINDGEAEQYEWD